MWEGKLKTLANSHTNRIFFEYLKVLWETPLFDTIFPNGLLRSNREVFLPGHADTPSS